ncbi:unnamed protein product [Parascedosporium putredinis]|uniref:S-adenosyl-L-methionine-dependent methyltransferase n=1 Tax=Parascedosporium putredinis TaxID=1442378 RepID=A0A9P1H939_9PEZI|nr:unnamed protein product [Parascedosporium putredinis]CAI8000564.1 unnamed protein product [Parascedosporium putredinis]
MENGRRYHAYKEGTYYLPNDEDESFRLGLQHHTYTLTYDGELYLCPAGRDQPVSRVLDCGTGTGLWAIDFGLELADENPEATVIGVDLSPTQPPLLLLIKVLLAHSVPPNVSFYVDDLEENWIYTTPFDFVHARMLTGALKSWPRLFEQSYENLVPGGWLEVSDITLPVRCDDDTFREDSDLAKWSGLMLEASHILDSPLDSAYSYQKQLQDAGFINVVERRFKWPHNHWPKARKYKEIGDGVSGLSLALFTRGLGWTAEDVEIFLAGVRKDMKDVRMHTYYCVITVYGQKPYDTDPLSQTETGSSPPPEPQPDE